MIAQLCKNVMFLIRKSDQLKTQTGCVYNRKCWCVIASELCTLYCLVSSKFYPFIAYFEDHTTHTIVKLTLNERRFPKVVTHPQCLSSPKYDSQTLNHNTSVVSNYSFLKWMIKNEFSLPLDVIAFSCSSQKLENILQRWLFKYLHWLWNFTSVWYWATVLLV